MDKYYLSDAIVIHLVINYKMPTYKWLKKYTHNKNRSNKSNHHLLNIKRTHYIL